MSYRFKTAVFQIYPLRVKKGHLSWGFFGFLKGFIIQLSSDILEYSLSLKKVIRLERCLGYLALFFRYLSKSIAIMAHHIWIRTALAEAPTKLFTRKSCLRCLKNTSMSQRALYSSAMVSAVQDKLLVIILR